MSGPPRIALDLRPALLGRSGVPRTTRELARALAREPNLRVKGFGHSFAWARVAPPAGVELRRLPIPGRTLPLLARAGWTMERLVGGADVAHWTDFVLPPVRVTTPLVWTAHDLAFLQDRSYHGRGTETLRARAEQAANRATAIVTPTEAIAREVVRRLGVPALRVRTIPWGIDHGGIRPEATTGTPRHLLCVGTVEPRKHHAALLGAWRRLGGDRPRLLVVGKKGWEADEIARQLDDAERTEPLEWLRSADETTLERAFDEALAVVYLSSYEGFGLPPLEALARGLPVLLGSAEACRELCGDEALCCEPTDGDSVLEGLRQLLREAPGSEGQRQGRMARARTYSWEACAASYAQLYREIAG